MTAVPSRPGVALLICDQCGDNESGSDLGQDADLVWPVVTSLGWSGSAFATGTHFCPRCSISEPPEPMHDTTTLMAGASYDVSARPDHHAVVVTPTTDLEAGLPEVLRDELMRAAAHGHVVIDLHTVRFIDSAALGLLVRAHQEAKQRGALLVLAAPSRFVRTVLHTMRLDGVLETYEDVPTALRATIGRGHTSS